MADDSAAAATAMPQAFEELEIPALDVSRAPGALDSNAGPAAGSAIQSPDAAAGAAAMGSAVGSATGAAGGEGGNSSSSGNKPRDPVSVALFHARRAPPTKKSLFVSELHEDTEFTALQRDFEPFGEIISVRVLRDAKSGKSRRIGYINFADAVAADAALHAKNGQPGPHGAPYVLTFADNDPSFTPQPTTKLFIRFIPQQITEAEVRQAFEPFGVVVDVSVALDTCRAAKKEPLPWNMAYVTFDKASDATAAIAKTDRQFLFGDLHHLVVKAAEDPETKKKRQEWRQQAQAALAPEKEKTPTNAANQQQLQSQQQQQQQQQSQKAGVGRSPKNADGANGARRDMSRNETFGRNLPAAVRAGPSMMPSQPMQYVAAAPPQAFVHLPPSPVNAQQVQQLSPHSQQQQQQRNGWVTLSPHGTHPASQQPAPQQQQQPQPPQPQQQVFWQQQQQQQPPQQHQGGYGGGQFGGAATNNNAVRPTNFFVQQPQQHNAVQNAEVPWLQPQHQQQQQQQQPQQQFYAFGGQQAPPRVGDGGHHVHLPYPLLQGGRSSRPPQQEGLWGPLGAGDQQQQGRQQQGGSNGTLNSLPTFGGGGGDAGWGAPAAPEPLSGSGLFNVSTVAQTTTHTTAPPSAQANPMSAHMHAAGHPSSGHAGVSAGENDAPPQLFMRAADGSFVPYTPAAQSSATRQQHGRGQ